MGEAKRRGTFEQRRSESIARGPFHLRRQASATTRRRQQGPLPVPRVLPVSLAGAALGGGMPRRGRP